MQLFKTLEIKLSDIIYFDYNPKSSVLLIFFFHAIIFSGLLIKEGVKQDKRHSKWLAAFIFLGALYISPFMLGYAGWYSETSYKEFLFFTPFQQLFLIGPVFFFYVKTLLNKELEFTQRPSTLPSSNPLFDLQLNRLHHRQAYFRRVLFLC